MAISENNVVTYGLKGKIGDLLVFRKQNGKTVVSKIPAKSSVPPSVLQIAVKERFKLASKFAQQAMLDVSLAPIYKTLSKKGQSAFNVAFADFYLPPTVSNPIGVYNGVVGTTLSVKAIDNYEVTEVSLIITEADGTLIEQGLATLQIDGVNWAYTCSSTFANPTGCILLWTAKDLAGNLSLLEITV